MKLVVGTVMIFRHWENETKTSRPDTEHFKALAKRDHSSAIVDHVKTTGQMGTFLHFGVGKN